MIDISYFQLELLFAVIWLLIRIAVWIRKKRIDWKREALLLLMYVNLAVIIRFTFFPMSLVEGRVQPLPFNASKVFPFKVNLVPFIYLADYDTKREMLLNGIGNICMFIPSGIVLPIIYKRLNSFPKVLAAGVLISLCTEILQLPFYTRTSDMDDLILNTIGVIIGYGIYALVRKLEKRKRRR